MRSAIRGDFERLADRRGDQELMRVVDEDDGAAQEDRLVSSEPEPEGDRAEPVPQRSWLARLLSP